MSNWQLPEWLAMLGLGSQGGQRLLDGGRMEAGVHLRWAMATSLGFPPDGFDIYRREHEPGPRFCAQFLPADLGWRTIVTSDYPGDFPLDVALEASGEVTLVRGCNLPLDLTALRFRGRQTVRVRLSQPARHVRIELARRSRLPVAATGFWTAPSGLVAVARSVGRRGQPGAYVLDLFADRIDEVTVHGRDFAICRICVVPVAINLASANLWGAPLNGTPIHLPVEHPEWPTPYANDATVAKRRLPSTLPAAVREAYADSYDDALFGLLFDLVGSRPQSAYSFTATDEEGGANGAAVSWNGLQLLHLMALDPNYARMLGLYAVDGAASPGVWYDYMVVGHWGSTRWPGATITFGELTAGTACSTGLSHQGLSVVTPRLLTVVADSWMGTPSVGIEASSAGIFSAPLWLLLPSASPSVSVRLRAEDAAVLQAYDGASAVGPPVGVSAGERLVRLEPGRPFDRIMLETYGPATLFGLALHERPGSVGDLHYATFRHRIARPAALPIPTLEAPVALARQTGLTPDGLPGAAQGAVGLRWGSLQAGGGFLRPGAPVLFQLSRSDLGDGEAAGPPLGRTIINRGAPVAPALDPELRPPGHQGAGLHYVDSSVPDGWYEYAVRGIDLFGRLGNWSAGERVELRDRLPPPPPPAVRAAYLDPGDPSLPATDRKWAAAHGSGLRVTWEWGGLQRLQAPDVELAGEFRIYAMDGQLNGLRGVAVAVSDLGPSSEITTDQRWDGTADELAGEWVRLGGTFFPIVGNTTGEQFTLFVTNLTDPAERPRPGALSIAYSSDRAYWSDPRLTTSWERRIAAEPARRIPIYRGTLASVDSAASPVVVETDQSPADLEEGLIPGVLVSDGTVYRAVSHRLDAGTLVIEVLPEEVPSEPDPLTADAPLLATPTPGSTFLYYPGVAYTRYVEGFELAVPTGAGIGVASITVSASDGAHHVLDQLRWTRPEHGGLGGRPGNEGPAAPAQQVMAALRQPPPAPLVASVAPGDPPIYARPADYHGIAHYTLTWDAVPGAVGYAVFRCSGAALVAWDRTVNGNPTPEAYGALSDVDLQALASREDTAGAFRRVNPEPVASTAYEDRFDGRGRGAFLYRIAALDAAGNVGAMSEALPPVHIYDVTPPETPMLSRVLGGERSVTLSWRANREADLAEYRLWRAESAEELADVRRLPPTAVLAPSAGAVEENYIDEGLAGARSYFYRLAAVDTNGNVSEATAVREARAVDTIPPEPPVWDEVASGWVYVDDAGIVYEWSADLSGVIDPRPAVRVTWLEDELIDAVLVARSDDLNLTPAVIANWTAGEAAAAGTRRVLDAAVDPSRSYEYQAQSRSSGALISRASSGISIPPP